MKPHTTPLIVGNWKMNPKNTEEAVRLTKEIKKRLGKVHEGAVVIAPPFLYTNEVSLVLQSGTKIQLGAQTMHHEVLGAKTGSVSGKMLQGSGVTYVIVGHSERRKEGESDETIEKQVAAGLRLGMTVVLCVGEQSRDTHGQYLSLIERQLRSALRGVSKAKLGNLVIAYEPIWAIGAGATPTSAEIHEMKLFIEKALTDMYGRNYAQKVSLLYGGSVTSKNAYELYHGGTIHGFLVGGASLDASEFCGIIQKVNTP